MIALIDYGAGNLTSVRKASRPSGATLFTPGDPVAISPRASGIVVPGVGHFGATAALDGAWTRGDRRRVGDAACPLLGSASACSGCSRAATRRRVLPGSV